MKKSVKVLFIVGTRPEAIKMCPLIQEFKNDSAFDAQVCFTGQHQEMVTKIFNAFQIKPEFSLNVMTAGQTLAGLTEVLFNRMGPIFRNHPWDLIVVQGDTTSCMVGGMLGFYEKIPVAHIEAGLRSQDLHSPFPEEFNRRVVMLTAKWHFPPTKDAENNLLKEGLKPSQICMTGNTGIDALLTMVQTLNTSASNQFKIQNLIPSLDLEKKLVLATLHRRESHGKPIEQIFEGLKMLAQRNEQQSGQKKSVQVLVPLHPNPIVRQSAKKIFGSALESGQTSELSAVSDNIILCEPLDYPEFVDTMNQAYLIVTDSGGVQEEAPSLGKALLVARESTERAEGVQAGLSKLLDMSPEGLVKDCEELLNNEELYLKRSQKSSIYGDGKASQRIKDYIKAQFT